MKTVAIVGAGLAGSEAALYLASHGVKVKLYDCKPKDILPIYKFSSCSELVCNNSLAPLTTKKPLGLLLEELKQSGSKLISIAETCRLKDDIYFSVDKKKFSISVANEIKKHNIEIINQMVVEVPDEDCVIIATGPLTNQKLINDISVKYNIQNFHFFDASSTIVDIYSINKANANVKKITDDLFAVTIPNDIFEKFSDILKDAECYSAHSIDYLIDFDKCQSIERLAKQGKDVLYKNRFFYGDITNEPCLLLRREGGLKNAFIMVGCMTTLTHSAQQKVFSLLPGFENVKIVKFGRMHMNTYFDSPKFLNCFYQIKGTQTYVIGQLSGIDGYLPAISSGLVASTHILNDGNIRLFSKNTMIGALAHYVSNDSVIDFKPMCASFSLLSND